MPPVFSLSEHLKAHRTGMVVKHPDGPDTVAPPPPNPGGEVFGWMPKNNSLFVMPLVEASHSKGGLVLADSSRERPQKGVVLAIGAGLWDDEQQRLYPVEAKVGDLVTYGKYSGEEFEIGGVIVYIMVNAEIKARCRAGNYPELTEHRLGEGTERERNVYHEPHLRCEHCPEEKSELIEEERARLVALKDGDLHQDVDVARMEGEGAPVVEP